MFDEIITDILRAEGWDTYTDRPNDRGGPTKWGITLKTLSSWRGHECTAQDVKDLGEIEARAIYEADYVIGPRFDALPKLLAPMLVDCGVNHGTSRAAKWLQLAVDTTPDGRIGPKTLQAVEAANPVAIYLKVCATRVSFYGKLVTDDPTQAENAHGWNNRAAKWLKRLADHISGG